MSPHVKKNYYVAIWTICLSSSVLARPDVQQAADILGWVPSNNNCSGYFSEPNYLNSNKTSTALPKSSKVTISQPGREITADTVKLKRGKKAKNLGQVTLQGNVHLREPGNHIASDEMVLDKTHGYIDAKNLFFKRERESRWGKLNEWGYAKRLLRYSDGVWSLKHANYSTCPPTHHHWQLHASSLTFDPKKGRASVTNAGLFLGNIPIAYFPYLHFSTTKKRAGGFLLPTIHNSSTNGLGITLPFYLNLAPNYDLTIAPEYIAKRGFLFHNTFRYLTSNNNGNMQIDIIPNDHLFTDFRENAPSRFGINPMTKPFLNQLSDNKGTRLFAGYNHELLWGDNWSSSLTLNYVTDDYYFQDFGRTPNSINNDQLLNQLTVNYDDRYWHFQTLLQGYQTLHQINRPSIIDLYRHLPQLSVYSSYPETFNRVNPEFAADYTYFDKDSDFITAPIATGNRFHIRTGAALPYHQGAFFIKPALHIDATQYQLSNNIENSLTRVLPIFDVETGANFYRNVYVNKQLFTQTLEPRLYYLYVPHDNQVNIPVFDTTLPVFTTDQLIRPNRFAGIDRIGDANQIATILTTRINNQETGEEKLRFALGQVFQLRDHTVCLTTECIEDPTADDTLSPLVADLAYHWNNQWSGTASIAWNLEDKRNNNSSVALHYQGDNDHIINIGYHFIRNGDIQPKVNSVSDINNLDRIDLNTVWPISKHWHVIGDWHYNIAQKRTQTYLYGLQYGSCCWSMRLVVNRNWVALQSNNQAEYDTTVYLQFLLKGLGNLGFNNPSDLLEERVNGYVDNF